MELGFELSMRQEQKLIMTPELRQSLKLLQASSQELSDLIRLEMEKNPLLELTEDEKASQPKPAAEAYPMDWKEYFQSVSGGNRGLDDPVYREDEQDFIDQTAAEEDVTLYEHLLLQLDISDVPRDERAIAAYIIRHIDDNGYLTLTKYAIAHALGISKDKAAQALKLVQSFEPAGVGARSLRECLLLQLKHSGRLTPELKTLVLEHLRDIAENHTAAIARKLKLSNGQVQEMCGLIRSLEPKPGRPFAGQDAVSYLIPDVIAEKTEEGYAVSLREYCAPRLTISKVYQNMLSNPASELEVTQFLIDRLQSAHRLIKAIEQRRLTIHKVVSAIVQHQTEFLEQGILALKPLNLKTIAKETGLHESTISRAISGKFVQTPRGVFELKFFFDHGVRDLVGKTVSSQSVKRLIYTILQEEDVCKPYSDAAIAEILHEKGIELSRRTIAKYREDLGVPGSSKRRRF